MPAEAKKITDKNSCYHIHNKGRDSKAIFTDNIDYNTFIDFLNEYLSSPSSIPIVKKSFTVKGKTYQGVPHKPKNYYNKIELVAYSLLPSSFSLLVKELEEGSVESFVRSLSTRYSIYYNKKYQHTGSVFDGPYKSIKIDGDESIDLLAFHFHKNGERSSLSKYLADSPPSWTVKQDNKINNYEDFINKFELNQTQKELLNKLTFHKSSTHQTSNTKDNFIPQNTSYNINNSGDNAKKQLDVNQRIPEVLFASTLFLFLIILALKNITTKQNVVSHDTSNVGQVAGTNINNNIITLASNPETPIIVYTNTLKTGEVAEIVSGTQAELVEQDTSWAEIKLLNGMVGFVESKYID